MHGLLLLTSLALLFGTKETMAVVTAGGVVQEQLYKTCAGLQNNQTSGQTIFRSHLECISMCTADDGCKGVDVCRTGLKRQVFCEQTSETSVCNDRSAGTGSSSCYHAQKTSGEVPLASAEVTTLTLLQTTAEEAPECIIHKTLETNTAAFCQNGGTQVGSGCQCPLGLAGDRCQRFIRDCAEPYHTTGFNNGQFAAHYIQPVNATAPFPVRCKFSTNPMTVVMRRNKDSPFPTSWAGCKTSHVGDLCTAENNFFSGLDNIHFLLDQAMYNLDIHIYHVSGTGGYGSPYNDFKIGPESSSYEVTFVTGSDGLSGAPPLIFSADGHDTYGCYSQYGKAGWYGGGTACEGYGIFAGVGDISWSRGGIEETVVQMYFIITTQTTNHYN